MNSSLFSNYFHIISIWIPYFLAINSQSRYVRPGALADQPVHRARGAFTRGVRLRWWHRAALGSEPETPEPGVISPWPSRPGAEL